MFLDIDPTSDRAIIIAIICCILAGILTASFIIYKILEMLIKCLA